MEKLIANNKKARHDYFFEETYEAGIVLTGTEIKSVRAGGVNLRDSYAKVEKGEVFVYNMNIAPYEKGNRYNTDPMRPKKLLLHKGSLCPAQRHTVGRRPIMHAAYIKEHSDHDKCNHRHEYAGFDSKTPAQPGLQNTHPDPSFTFDPGTQVPAI